MKDRFLNKRARRLWAFLLMLGLFLQTLGSFTVRPAGQEVSDGSQSAGDAQIVPMSETETVSGSAIQITVYTGEGEKPVSAENLLKADASGELSFYLRVDFELGKDFSVQLPDKITVPSNIDGGSGFPILDAEDYVLATVTHVDNSLKFTIGDYVKDNHLTGTGHFEVGGFKYKPEPAAEAGLTGSEQLEFKDGNGNTITSVTLYFQWAEQAPWIQKTEDACTVDGVNYRRFTILLKPGNLYQGFELTDTLENVAFTDAVAPTIQRGSGAAVESLSGQAGGDATTYTQGEGDGCVTLAVNAEASEVTCTFPKDMKPTETYTLVYYALEDSAMYKTTESSTVKNTGVLKASAAGGEASGLQQLSESDLDWGCRLSTERTVTPKPIVAGFEIDEDDPSLLHWTVTLNSNEISMGSPKLYVKIGEGRHEFQAGNEEFELDGSGIDVKNIDTSSVTASNDVGYTYGITGLGTTTNGTEILSATKTVTFDTYIDDEFFLKNESSYSEFTVDLRLEWTINDNGAGTAAAWDEELNANRWKSYSVVTKEGANYEAANGIITWKITLNPAGKTLTNAVLTDAIPAGQNLYSVKIGDGTEILAESLPSQGAGDEPAISYDDTTKSLEIKYSGEISDKVVITLKTKLADALFCKNNNEVQYGNTVTLTSDEITGSPVSASGNQYVSSEILSKWGWYNAATRHVQWTVVLNSTGFDLNNVVMTDTIPAGQQYVTGTFQVDGTKLTVTEGNAASSGEATLQEGDNDSTVLTYRVDELSKTTTITYETEITDLKPFYSAPSSGNYMSVGNAVELAYDVDSTTGLKQEGVSASAQVPVSVLKKDCNYTPYSMYADWTITVNEAYMKTTNGVLIDRFTSNMELDTTSVSVKYQASESGSASDAVINYSIADDVADVEAGSVTLVYTGETEQDEDGSTWKSFRLYLPKETSGKFTVSYRTKLVDKTKTSADNTASFLCDEMGEEAGQLGIGTQKNDRPITFVLAAGGGSASGTTDEYTAVIKLRPCEKMIVNGNDLSGAEFTLYDGNGLPVTSGTTDANGILIIEKLKPGSYYVKQEKAAVGYTLDPLGTEMTPTDIEGCRKVEVAQEHTVDNPLEVPYCNAIRTAEPTEEPEPTAEPTEEPEPTAEPTEEPKPTAEPTEKPEPIPVPTEEPEPTEGPQPIPEPTETPQPTPEPTAVPEPTTEPEVTPSPEPTAEPTEEPKPTATPELTPVPSRMPEATPSPKPTEVPLPTLRVTPHPTETPTARLIFDTADENIPDIAGRKFEVRTMESEVVAEVTMDENGHFEIDELPYGEYLLVEIFDFENPEGTPFIFPIKSEGDVVQLVYKDGRLLPKTGLVDSIYFYIIGLAIVAAGAAAVVKKRREHGA